MKTEFHPRDFRVAYRWSSRLVHRVFPSENALLLALAFVVGVGSGFGALAFEFLIEFFRHGFGSLTAIIPFAADHAAVGTLITLILAGIAGGILLRTVARSSRGHGVPDVMARAAIGGGRISPRVVGDTTLTASVCIGAGGSAGPEGPIIHIGSAIGSAVGQAMHMSTERLRILVACGAAGGISAIFGAPLAGVMFAVEVIVGDFGVRSLTAIVVSSVLAAVTHQGFVSWEPRFEVPDHGMISFSEVPFVIVLGLLAGGVSWLFIKALYWTEDRFHDFPGPPWVRPAVGMFGVGVIAAGFPEVLGDGYAAINEALNARLAWQIMGLLVFMKLLATCLTVGSGNVGGLFAPSMVIGAMMGAAYGVGVELVFPDQGVTPALFALVGMAAVIAGTTHATIASILLIFEVTNDYALVLPVMLAAATSVVLSTYLNRESIYSLKLAREGIHLRRGVEVNVMNSIPVGSVMRPPRPVIFEDMRFNDLLRFIEDHEDTSFPVVDRGNRLFGVIAYRDLRSALRRERSPEMDRLVMAGDLAVTEPETVTPDQNLNHAMQLFGMRDLSVLPVVAADDDRRLVGKLYRSDVLSAYRRALLRNA